MKRSSSPHIAMQAVARLQQQQHFYDNGNVKGNGHGSRSSFIKIRTAVVAALFVVAAGVAGAAQMAMATGTRLQFTVYTI